MSQWVIQTYDSNRDDWATIAHFAFEEDAKNFALWANVRNRLNDDTDSVYRAFEETTMPETKTDAKAECQEFEAQLGSDIRYHALQVQVAHLSAAPLTPKGLRMLHYYLAERDALRIAGMALAADLFV